MIKKILFRIFRKTSAAKVAPRPTRGKGKTKGRPRCPTFRFVNSEVTLALTPRSVSSDRFQE